MPPTPSPAAAAAPFDAHLAQLVELELHGRAVLARTPPARLAADLYAAVYVAQVNGRLNVVDLDAIEDLAVAIAAADYADEQARAA